MKKQDTELCPVATQQDTKNVRRLNHKSIKKVGIDSAWRGLSQPFLNWLTANPAGMRGDTQCPWKCTLMRWLMYDIATVFMPLARGGGGVGTCDRHASGGLTLSRQTLHL